MCGFAVLLDGTLETPPEQYLHAAAAELAHRGPDDFGCHAEPGIGMVFRRLSIVDVAHGAQPLSNEDGSVWIVFNGEIYNHEELREELESRGHRYSTHSDTESIVHAYEEWGAGCVERLRGMFAFAIWDRRTRRLFAARDRIGIKPLYFVSLPGGGLACGSEIKALLAFPGVKRDVDRTRIAEYLTLRYCAAPSTMFAGIEKLPAGHILEWNGSSCRTSPYWDANYEPKIDIGPDEALEELEGRLEEAVRMRLMSEVPLGALLSGGVDSSLIVALMGRMLDKPVQTFSVGFDAPGPYSELPFAREVATHCGTEHHEIVVGANDLLEAFPLLAWHQDEPVSEPAAIPTYMVSKLARETVTVVMTGEGGDELFGGYPKYAADPLARRIASLPAGLRDFVLDHGISRLPFRFRKLQVVGRSARYRGEAERLASWFAGFVGDERDSLLDGALRDDGDTVAAFRRALDRTHASKALDRMLDVDLRIWLPDDLLMKMDKMSMAASVEARVPLLDHPLVEWAARLPSGLKVRGVEGKWLLKKLARKYLPHNIIDRPKVGFTVPLSPWFRGPLREFLADTLLSRASLDRGYFQKDVLRRMVSEHVEGRRDRGRELWTLLALELWHRAYVDQPPRRPVPYQAPPRANDLSGQTSAAS